MARAAVGKGKHRLAASSGDWDEERTVEVNAETPVEVEFHRPWLAEQRIRGRLMIDGAPLHSFVFARGVRVTPRDNNHCPLFTSPSSTPTGHLKSRLTQPMLLIQANQNISLAQLKLALADGRHVHADGGVMGGGAGSVNFWSSRKIAANGLTGLSRPSWAVCSRRPVAWRSGTRAR